MPLTVVMRTRSRVPERALEPPTVYMVVVPVSPKFPEQTQEFEPISVSTNVPSNAAVAFPDLIVKPVVYTLTPGVALMVLPVHAYPDVSTEPAPIWIIGGLVPLVLTPLNITVIRLTQDGILVKSMLVPDVDATAVPETIGYTFGVKPPTFNVPVIVSLPEFVNPGVVTPAVPSNVIAMIAPYSNRMLTLPLSKASVPLNVVRRT